MDETDFYREGYTAYKTGKPLNSNPHDQASQFWDWREWRAGWVDAAADARQTGDETQ